MKKPILTSVLWTGLLFMVVSCSDDNEILSDLERETTAVSFAFVLNDLVSDREAIKQQMGNIPECIEDEPAFVEVVVTQDGDPVAGSLMQALRLNVKQDSQGIYFTEEHEELELLPENYTLDYFRVLNKNLQVIWIAPIQEPGKVNFASMVESPLPLEISLQSGTKKYVDVDVICYDSRLVNYYGYLFFELEGNQAIEFCIFGNYCDDNGRHAEAIRYEVSVWSYSGDESAPKGTIIYDYLESGIIIEDDFENEVSITYAVPLCIMLPDTAGEDQYYFEISILDGVGYEVEDPLIRRGVITDEDVKFLFDGNSNLDYYHFREGNCNLGDSPKLFEEVEGESSVDDLFIPAIQSMYGGRGGVEWVHEYDANGTLIKSMLYELHPHRLLWEFNYNSYNESGLPHEVESIYYRQNDPSALQLEFTFSDHKINIITTYDDNGNFRYKQLVTDFDSANRITGSISLDENDEFISRTITQFDSQGRIENTVTYSSESGTSEEDIIRRDVNSYNSFGEIHTSKQLIEGVERELEYIYRDDKTLQKLKSVTYEDVPIFQTIEYDEDENRTFSIIIQGDYRTEYTFFEDGLPHIVSSYYHDFLYRVITYNEDRSSEWKFIEESDNSYRIEYKDPSGNIYKTEYYNSDGELISEETS